MHFPQDDDYPVCDSCISSLNPHKGKRCTRCSYRLISENLVCTRCRKTDYFFDSNYSLFEYTGAIKELLYHYKFKGRQTIARLFARLIGEKTTELYPGLPLVPVPSSKRSKKKRGCDHIKTIVNLVERRFGAGIVDVLARTTDIPQKELNYTGRIENLKGKIIYTGKNPHPGLSGAVLIDDVFTTGATASECARVLKENGVRNVYVITIAIDI
jgi:ComF family protein